MIDLKVTSLFQKNVFLCVLMMAMIACPLENLVFADNLTGKTQASDVELINGLPEAGKVEFHMRDIVIHAGLEAYVASENDGGRASSLHPSDIFDLNNAMITFLEDKLDETELDANAAYLYAARAQGVDHILTLDDDVIQRAVMNNVRDQGYNVTLIKQDVLDEMLALYLEQRAARVGKKTRVVNELYDNIDILDYVKFDQEGRICDMDDEAKIKACIDARKTFVDILEQEQSDDQCRGASLGFVGRNLTVDQIEYAAAYHNVVDHKAVKFMIDDKDYDREKLREYMDGALNVLNQKGFDPADKNAMKTARDIRAQMMKLCINMLVTQHSNDSKDVK